MDPNHQFDSRIKHRCRFFYLPIQQTANKLNRNTNLACRKRPQHNVGLPLLRHPSGFSVRFLGCPTNIRARKEPQHHLLRRRSLRLRRPRLPARRGGCMQCGIRRGTTRRNPRCRGWLRLHLGLRWGGLETNRNWATTAMVGSFAKQSELCDDWGGLVL
jgi:hypothetical protein